MSLRLSDEAEGRLEEWVEEGRFESKSEAVRAALNTYDEILQRKERGERVLAFSQADLEALREDGNLVVGREL